jgi:hypothetical protein
MTETDSRLFLPPVMIRADHRLDLEVRPSNGAAEGRRFYVIVNDRLVVACILHRATILSYVIPADVLNSDRYNYIRFSHPDVCIPEGDDPATQDLRRLSVGLHRITLTSVPSQLADMAISPVKKKFPWS